MQKICTQIIVPDFLILINSPKQAMNARNSFKVRYFEGEYQKTLKKLT